MAKPQFMNVKVDKDVVRKAKIVATVRNITLSNYITHLVRSHVERDLAEVASGLAEPAVVHVLAAAERDGRKIG